MASGDRLMIRATNVHCDRICHLVICGIRHYSPYQLGLVTADPMRALLEQIGGIPGTCTGCLKNALEDAEFVEDVATCSSVR